MRRSLGIALALVVLVAGVVTADGEQGKVTKYGKELTLKETTKVSKIMAEPDAYHDKRVVVEGTIVDVCKKRGCWIKIASDREHETIMFKVADGVMVFPLESKGKFVRAEGVVFRRHLTKEEIEEHKKAEGKACEGCATAVIMIKGDGAVVTDAPPVAH